MEVKSYFSDVLRVVIAGRDKTGCFAAAPGRLQSAARRSRLSQTGWALYRKSMGKLIQWRHEKVKDSFPMPGIFQSGPPDCSRLVFALKVHGNHGSVFLYCSNKFSRKLTHLPGASSAFPASCFCFLNDLDCLLCTHQGI